MTDYKAIFGKKIKFITSDLNNAEGEGEIFYSDTDKEFKVAVASAAWSAGSNVITAKTWSQSVGTQSANLYYGGEVYPTPSAGTDEYDGTGWASSNNMNLARGSIGGFGTQTAAVAVSGTHPAPSDRVANVEEYNGSSWTVGENYPTSATTSRGSGTLTAGINMGGYASPGAQVASNEYDGTDWTAGGDMSNGRDAFMSATAGSQTATLVAGGGPTPTGMNCETYDGSSWTEVGNLPAAYNSHAGAGTQTNALSHGGEPPAGIPTGVEAFTWDGTSWTAGANMAKHRIQHAGSGTGTAALAISGVQPGAISDTEEYNVTAMTVTAGAWANGGAMPAGKDQMGTASAGTQTATAVFGGISNPSPAPGNRSLTTLEYDGSSWSGGGNLPAAGYQQTGLGTLTAAVSCMSNEAPGNNSEAYHYDGSSWTAGGNVNTYRATTGGAGTQTAGLIFGGYVPPNRKTECEEYDGTSWTESGDLNTASRELYGSGTQTAALAFVQDYAPGASAVTEEYNGSAWTAGGSMNTARKSGVGGGTQTATLATGGHPALTISEIYDGSSWVTAPNLATGKAYAGGAGTTTAGIAMGGQNSLTATEEFTAETTALNLKTITDS